MDDYSESRMDRLTKKIGPRTRYIYPQYPQRFRTGDIVRVSGTGEGIKVTGNDGVRLTIDRGIGASPAAAAPKNTDLIIVGNASGS